VRDRALAALAIGRILRIASRPAMEGDIEEFYRCRAIILDAADGTDVSFRDNSPNWIRDRMRGAAGD
jgi:hypothetical protein